jgi:hypothetical protein
MKDEKVPICSTDLAGPRQPPSVRLWSCGGANRPSGEKKTKVQREKNRIEGKENKIREKRRK